MLSERFRLRSQHALSRKSQVSRAKQLTVLCVVEKAFVDYYIAI